MLISKKFSKFYLNRFRPITIQEDHDVQRARNMYRSFTMLGAIGMGLLSFKYRKMKVASIENYEAKVDPNLLSHVLNDMSLAALGYFVSHIFVCDYIYKHRQYVIERMHYERDVCFDRDNFDIEEASKAEALNL